MRISIIAIFTSLLMVPVVLADTIEVPLGGDIQAAIDGAPDIEDSTFCGNMPGGPGTDENQVEGPFNDGGGNCFTAVCGYGDGDELPECGSACPADIDGNGVVNGADLSLVLGAWGTSDAAADVDGSGTVDGADLALVLGAWGACPE